MRAPFPASNSTSRAARREIQPGSIHLPLVPAGSERALTHDEGSRPAPDAPLTGHRILVVDDDVDAADSLGMLLELLGNQTHIAYDGMSAIDATRTFRPEVILLDIGMPGMDGHDTCRHIRQSPWGQDVTIIALTGWSQEQARRQSREAGFDLHFVKPVDPDHILEILAKRGMPTAP
ncbi:response regulator [Chondromyces apiculatus]|nr:response regulator [Chondromyces apiculatus]